ncbi:hypothetical protein SEA_CHADMASTERC_26 [Gordonia phage ChadMasterC]|nr:hypothetical protein SEA_CHADMASTERC_26 [Gordonia phage ChadMasterC]
MPYTRPTIVSGVTRATKAFFDNLLDGIDESEQQVAPGLHVVNPRGLRRWHSALADATLGLARVSVIGDSITYGTGGDGTASGDNPALFRTTSWAAQMRALFARQFDDPGEGFQYRYDGSWTFANGALSHVSTAPYSGGGRISAVGQTITVVVNRATTVNFWTWDGGNGTGQYAVDGAAPVTFPAGAGNTAVETWTKHTISGLSAGASHTLVFSLPAAGNVYLSSIESRIGDRGVQVNRMGRPGNTTNNMVGKDSGIAGNAAGMSRVTKAWDIIHDADVYVIPLGTNDYGRQNSRDTLTEQQPGTNPTEYRANLQQMVDLFAARGKCTLLVGEPRTPNVVNPMNWEQSLYWEQMRDVAATTDHCAFVDIAEVWGTATQALALGLHPVAATVHPSRAGHGSMAQIVHRVLTAPVGGSTV